MGDKVKLLKNGKKSTVDYKVIEKKGIQYKIKDIEHSLILKKWYFEEDLKKIL